MLCPSLDGISQCKSRHTKCHQAARPSCFPYNEFGRDARILSTVWILQSSDSTFPSQEPRNKVIDRTKHRYLIQ